MTTKLKFSTQNVKKMFILSIEYVYASDTHIVCIIWKNIYIIPNNFITITTKYVKCWIFVEFMKFIKKTPLFSHLEVCLIWVRVKNNGNIRGNFLTQKVFISHTKITTGQITTCSKKYSANNGHYFTIMVKIILSIGYYYYTINSMQNT
jgi:hypothetical protein